MLSERQKPNILVIIKLTSLILDVHKSHYFDFSGKIMIFFKCSFYHVSVSDMAPTTERCLIHWELTKVSRVETFLSFNTLAI